MPTKSKPFRMPWLTKSKVDYGYKLLDRYGRTRSTMQWKRGVVHEPLPIQVSQLDNVSRRYTFVKIPPTEYYKRPPNLCSGYWLHYYSAAASGLGKLAMVLAWCRDDGGYCNCDYKHYQMWKVRATGTIKHDSGKSGATRMQLVERVKMAELRKLVKSTPEISSDALTYAKFHKAVRGQKRP